jgi:hypothetical protein
LGSALIFFLIFFFLFAFQYRKFLLKWPQTQRFFFLQERWVYMNSQGNTQQKEQCWGYHNIRLQTILQSHSNKDSMVLAQKQA